MAWYLILVVVAAYLGVTALLTHLASLGDPPTLTERAGVWLWPATVPAFLLWGLIRFVFWPED